MTKFNWMDTGTVTGGIPGMGRHHEEEDKIVFFGPAKKSSELNPAQICRPGEKVNLYYDIQ